MAIQQTMSLDRLPRCSRAVARIVSFLFVMLLQSFDAHAGLYEFFSEKSYQIAYGECDPIDERALRSAQQMHLLCTNRPLWVRSLGASASDIAELAFFDAVRVDQLEARSCARIRTLQLAIDLPIFVLEDFAAKIPVLRELKAKIRDLTARLQLESAKIPKNPNLKLSAQQEHLKNTYLEGQQELIRLTSAANALVASVPESDSTAIQQLMSELAGNESVSNEELAKRLKEAFSNAGNDHRDARAALLHLERGEYPRAIKEQIVGDLTTFDEFVLRYKGDPEALRGLRCQLDAKYGRGTRLMEDTLMIGSIALSLGAGIARTAASKAIMAGASAARTNGMISTASARVLTAGAVGVTSLRAFRTVDMGCMETRLPEGYRGKSCENSNDYVRVELAQSNCALSAVLAALELGGMARVTNLKSTLASIRLGETPTTSVFRSSQIAKFLSKDPRLAMVGLSKGSKTVDEIDNFSSPATQQLIFSRKASDAALDAMGASSNKPTLLTGLLNGKGGPLSSLQQDLISELEKRFRSSVEILNGASKAGGGQTLVTLEQYPKQLKEYIGRSLDELAQLQNGSEFRELAARVASVEEKELLRLLTAQGVGGQTELAIVAAKSDFTSEFMRSIQGSGTFTDAFSKSNLYIAKGLEELPVGIGVRTFDMTSTVRFGDKNFYGNYFNYNATPNAAYERAAKKMGGLAEAQLNVPNVTKKRLAVNLDRIYQNLDNAYGLEKKCDRMLHVCGTSAPYMLIKSGAPVPSYGFATPSHPVLSLAVQKAIGMPHVKEMRATGFTSKNTPIGIPIVLLHDASPYVTTELPIYTLMIGSAAGGAMALVDMATGESVDVTPQGEIKWNTVANGMFGGGGQ